MNKSITSVSLIALALVSRAHAAETYPLEVSRVQGDLTCDISGADGGSVDCTSSVNAQGKATITMSSVNTGSGFAGVDKFKDLGGTNALVVVADSSKNLVSVNFASVQEGTDSVQLELSSTATSTLDTMYVSPLNIKCTDDETCSFTMSYVMYGSSSGGLSAMSREDLTGLLLKRIKPVIAGVRASGGSVK